MNIPLCEKRTVCMVYKYVNVPCLAEEICPGTKETTGTHKVGENGSEQ